MLVLDVDGVLTDGGLIVAADGRELKKFHALDGAGIRFWQKAGFEVAIISGRNAEVVDRRARELDIVRVYQGFTDKREAWSQLLEEVQLSDEQVAIMGDDLMELPLMQRAGFSIAPANAVPEVKSVVDLVTHRHGGNGAVREAIEFLLKAKGCWDIIMRGYQS